MARIDTLGNFLTDVATSIRTKKGTTDKITPKDFDTEIESIQSGGGTPNLQEKSITIEENTTTEIVADSDYEGLSKVSVTTNVAGGATGTEIPDGGWAVTKWEEKWDFWHNYIEYSLPRELTVSGIKTVLQGHFEGGGQYQNNFSQLKKIILKKGFASVSCGVNAFANLYNLEVVDMSELDDASMDTGWECFQNDVNLKEVDFNKIKYISRDCFYGCTNLTSPETLPNHFKNIPAGAFNGCKSITFKELNNNITSIGTYANSSGFAFSDCTNLQLTKLPDSLTELYGGYNFTDCKNITISKIPDGITKLSSSAGNDFNGCIGITSMNLNNVTTLTAGSTFSRCTNLSTVMADNVESIGNNVFNTCTSLKYICLPKLTKADNNTFYNSGLVEIWIGENITSAGLTRYFLANTANLEKIYINLPRTTVEGFANYQYGFQGPNTDAARAKIVCNDDNGFLTQEEFKTKISNT